MKRCAWLAMAIVCGCSSSHNNLPSPDGGTSMSIGAAGGTLTLADGSGVTIPAGALSSDVMITIAPAVNPVLPSPSAFVLAGTPYTFGPEGTQFQMPVTITLALSSAGVAQNAVVVIAPTGTSNFELIMPTVLDATHVQAQTTHFSMGEPMYSPCMDSQCPTGTKCCQCAPNSLMPDFHMTYCEASNVCCK